MKKTFYCQKLCGEIGSTIQDWNQAFHYCNENGIKGLEQDKILSPELFPCSKQCSDCLTIVRKRQKETQLLITNKNKKS